MDWIVRSDVILLGLMLLGVVAIAIHVSYRLRQGRRPPLNERARRQLAADLGVEVAAAKAIVVIAPYLGLVGACLGTVDAFTGIGMEKESALAAVASRVALSFVTTVMGTLVAIVAAFASYYLVSRVESFRSQRSSTRTSCGKCFRLAPRFPLRRRFSALPAYALIAAPTFACLIAAASPYVDPRRATGFAVDLETVPYDVGGRWMVLRVTEQGELFLNFEKEEWGTLSSRLAEIYRLRADRTICLLADEDVQYGTVMDAIDAVESAEMPDGEPIRMRMITPKAIGGCPVPRLAPRPARHVVGK
jgi:MotA/TolQ/ExbB proton channel family